MHVGAPLAEPASTRRVVLLVISTWLLPLTRPATQQLGQRIRVLVTNATPDQWVVGDLEAQDGDSLRLRVAGQAQPLSIARSSLRRLEVGRGQRRAVFQGAGVGFGLGALIGALTQLGREPSQSHTCASFNSLCPVEVEARVIRDGLIGGAVGALLGTAIGSAVKPERWEALPLGPARVSLAPRGAGLGLSFTF